MAALIAGSMLAGGCSTKPPPDPAANASTGFKADANSGQAKKEAQAWIAAHKDWATDKDLRAILTQPENQGVRDLLASPRCTETAPKGLAGRPGGANAPFIATATRRIADLYDDRQKPESESLRRDALDASSVDVSFSAIGFRGIRCAVYARYAESDPAGRPGLLAVLAIEQKFDDGKFTDYFRFRPIYVRANNSIAKTASGTTANPSRVAISFAVVARQLVVNNEGAAAFAELGKAAVTVPRVRVNGEETPCAQSACTGLSAPIPVPIARGSVAMAIGVSEAGDVGVDIDQAAIEREAIKVAVGPAGSAPAPRQPERKGAK